MRGESIYDQVSARPTFTLVSSIVANNNGTGADVAATPTGGFLPTFTIYASSSLIEKLCPAPGCNLFVSGTGNRVGPCNDLPACFDPLYPLLGPLQANGGPTRTHALLPGSPAINTGSNPLGLTTDQRGTGFPRVNGGSADMGAYESP